jgi:membrane protease YdiL (CAAX protease family)
LLGDKRHSLARITIGVAFLYGVKSLAATLTGSLRGEAGLAICVLVIVAALAAERVLFGVPPRRAVNLLGLTRPPAGGLLPVLLVCVPLVAYYPVLGMVTGSAAVLRDGWIVTAIGVFLQGGIAEEVIWRGFLFRHLWAGRDFWTAHTLTMGYMLAAHAVLFWSLDPLFAAAAIVITAAIVFPMCRVFELDRGAIWSVALLHAVVQGMPKLFEVPAEMAEVGSLAIVGWAVLTLVPLLVFAFWKNPSSVQSGVR